MHDQRDAFPGRAQAYGDQLIFGQKIAGTHAKRGHDEVSLSGESEADALRSPTTRRRALSPAGFFLACSPQTRRISPHHSSRETPTAWPPTVPPTPAPHNPPQAA